MKIGGERGGGRRLEGREGGRFNFHLEAPGLVAAVARIIRGMIGERMSTQDQDISALFYSLGWSGKGVWMRGNRERVSARVGDCYQS